MALPAAYALGYPRIGLRRELKRSLEKFWQCTIDHAQLLADARELRDRHWQQQKDASLDRLPVGDFSLYDHVLDTAVRFGIVPERVRTNAAHPLDVYFRMARGRSRREPATEACDMTKWFGTNYHYVVPEIEHDHITVHDDLSEQIAAARRFELPLNVVVLGPVTLLALARAPGDRLALLPRLLDAYRTWLTGLPLERDDLVQLEEPIASVTLDSRWQSALRSSIEDIAAAFPQRVLIACCFGDNTPLLRSLLHTPLAGVHVDATVPTAWRELARWHSEKILAAGVIDGRQPWRTDLRTTLSRLRELRHEGPLHVTTSCSLLHSPYDLDLETSLDAEVRSWLAFGRQKLTELAALRTGLVDGGDAIAGALADSDTASAARTRSARASVPAVRERVSAGRTSDGYRKDRFPARFEAQRARLSLPPLPTTTIGSFPQTSEIRRARAARDDGRLSEAEYTAAMHRAIDAAIDAQHAAGLDVLVHGEPERNDMVEYFGAELDGMLTTEHGWVQSYGSRCVKPPVIYGDVSRPKPITLDWIRYAQSRTNKPVKGMLTGPVTIMKWSFVRDDLPPADVAEQIAWALHDEVADLQSAWVGIVQIDEPAFREAMPLRNDQRAAYVEWATRAFRIAASAAKSSTQIHTHMCYSDVNDVLEAIERLDADVLTVEAARSGFELLKAIADSGYAHSIGPGVYDVHSPAVPVETDIARRIGDLLRAVPAERLWVNPDCGLKTRRYEEVLPALTRMVAATRRVRAALKL